MEIFKTFEKIIGIKQEKETLLAQRQCQANKEVDDSNHLLVYCYVTCFWSLPIVFKAYAHSYRLDETDGGGL